MNTKKPISIRDKKLPFKCYGINIKSKKPKFDTKEYTARSRWLYKPIIHYLHHVYYADSDGNVEPQVYHKTVDDYAHRSKPISFFKENEVRRVT